MSCVAMADAPAPITELTLPIVTEPLTLTCFSPLSGDATAYGFYDNLAKTPTAEFFFKKTGITIDYIHPPSGQEVQQFNLLISSDEIPDIISGYVLQNYTGGTEQAIQDGFIIDVADLVDKYAPNFKKKVLGNPDVRKLAYNDNGVLTGFGAYYSAEYDYDGGLPYAGLVIRQDLLDKYNLPMPVTIDDYKVVLKAMKEDGIETPLAWGANGWDVLRGSSAFASAFDVHGGGGFQQKEGKSFFSAIEPGYKEYLALLHEFYQEGYVSPDFMTLTYVDNCMPLFVEGKAGILPTHLYLYNNINQSCVDKGYNVQAAPMPRKTADQKLFISDDYGFFGGADLNKNITRANQHPVETVMAFDYLYTDEGSRLTNWGIEGESYKIGDDGLPMLTEELIKDLYRLNVVYCPNELNQWGDKEHDLIQYPLTIQHDAWRMWRDNITAEWRYPPSVSRTPEETTRRAEIMTDVNTYVADMFMKYVRGDESLDTFDDYVATVKGMGIDEAIAIDDAAIARYYAR